MAHSLSPVSKKDVGTILEAEPFALPVAYSVVLYLLIAAAVLAFVVGIMGDAEQSRLSWLSFHTNLLFWLALATASAGFSAVFHICNAQWARPLRRLYESTVTFLPFMIVGLGVFYFGHDQIFVWANEPIEGKAVWLNSPAVFFRDIFFYAILAYLISRVVKLSVGRDILATRSDLMGLPASRSARWGGALLDHYVQGWNVKAGSTTIKAMTLQITRLSPAVVIFYAIGMSLIAFDLIMSVDPHWYSTLFGAFIFMSAVYMATAWAAISVGFARELHPIFRAKIERRTLHDLGKLLFGFGIFWAYLFWSHYLTIWYGNIPEETQWVVTRLRNEPWHGFAWVIFGASFIIPFLIGLSRDAKQMPHLLFATAVIVLCGMWLQMYLLIVPTLYNESIPLSWRDLVIAFGFMAGLMLCQARFLSRVPLIPFGDLYE